MPNVRIVNCFENEIFLHGILLDKIRDNLLRKTVYRSARISNLNSESATQRRTALTVLVLSPDI